MIEATWSVGLPSLSATSQVPASCFNFSRAALVGGVGSLGVALSPAGLAAESVRVRMVSRPPARIRRTIVVPPYVEIHWHVVETFSRRNLVERQPAKSTCGIEKKWL